MEKNTMLKEFLKVGLMAIVAIAIAKKLPLVKDYV